jgi:hypothetical protein
MPVLLEACPSFAPAWADYVESWSDEPERGGYLDVATFAHHLVGLLGRADTDEFPAVFRAVERLYEEGDAGQRYLLTFGLLESIQNVASNEHDWPFARRFRRWLGPTTLAAWDEVHRLWGTADGG